MKEQLLKTEDYDYLSTERKNNILKQFNTSLVCTIIGSFVEGFTHYSKELEGSPFIRAGFIFIHTITALVLKYYIEKGNQFALKHAPAIYMIQGVISVTEL